MYLEKTKTHSVFYTEITSQKLTVLLLALLLVVLDNSLLFYILHLVIVAWSLLLVVLTWGYRVVEGKMLMDHRKTKGKINCGGEMFRVVRVTRYASLSRWNLIFSALSAFESGAVRGAEITA